MCGIHGFSFSDPELIKQMIASTHHRGPDGQGSYIDDHVSLGHNRLKIIDLSERAAQPMFSHDREQVLVFNGEIYNFQELRKELNYPFSSNGDSEVLLALYQRYGVEFVSRLSGMFAFALWDRSRRLLLLARDPVGIKPLYYALQGAAQGAQLIFSSEIKAILQHRIERELDLAALNLFLSLTYVPHPYTGLRGVLKFPAGHIGVFRDGDLRLTRYWNARPPAIPNKRSELADLVKQQVTRSVQSQLVSDRPVGLFLSGGLDSNILLERMHTLSGKTRCFSVGFRVADPAAQVKFNHDLELAQRSAQHFGAQHHTVTIDAQSFADALPETVYHLDEPIGDPTFVAMYCLSRFAKQNVDVVLTGAGGDELFGGYPRYRYNLALSWLKRLHLPSCVLKRCMPRLDQALKTSGAKRIGVFLFEDRTWQEQVFDSACLGPALAESYFDRRFGAYLGDDALDHKFMTLDRESWLVDESLLGFDKTSMAFGLEARVPLLDLPLVQLSDALPLNSKLSLLHGKLALRRAFQKELPQFLLEQPKRGFFSPTSKWLREPALLTLMREALRPEYCSGTKDLIRWPVVQQHLEQHIAKHAYRRTELFSLLTLQIWCKRFNVALSSPLATASLGAAA